MYSLLHLLLGEVIGYSWGFLLLGIADVLAIASVPSVLLRRRGRPLAAMSWMLALFVLPYVGIMLWWLIGREHIRRKQRLRQRSTEQFSKALGEVDHDRTSAVAYEAFDPLLPRGLFDNYDVFQLAGPTESNQAELLVDGEEAFPAIARMVEGGEEYVHLLFYIWQSDQTGRRLRDLLVDKARQGVEVRVLLDAFGSPNFKEELAEPLCEAGGRVGRFLPPTYLTPRPTFNFRNHRKLVVVDGREAVTGGMNVGEEYEHDWHDLAMHLRGPVVQDLHRIFLDDWLYATGENLAADRYLCLPDESITEDQTGASCAVFASGPDTRTTVLQDGLMHAINGAKDRLWMMTPYFIPNTEIVTAFGLAVQRGVDVRLMLPEQGDVALVRRASRAYYPMLLNAGIRLFEYRPRILHAKGVLVDDRYAMLGSANLDVRSFEIDFELMTFVASRQLNSHLADVFTSDLDQSREILLEDVQSQWWLSTLADSIAHLTSPQL